MAEVFYSQRRLAGGVHPPEHKRESSERPIRAAPLPRHLFVPLRQHVGNAATVRVTAGERVRRGQRIGEGEEYVSAHVHAPASGVVRAIAPHPMPTASGLTEPCVVIEPDGGDEWEQMPPWPDWRSRSAFDLRSRVREAGIVGLGGAAFPTAVKINPRTGVHTLLLNAAECEPWISCDDRLMRERSAEIVVGAAILMRCVGAAECLIGIEDNKPQAVAALAAAIDGWDGPEPFRIGVVPSLYPSGTEKLLIDLLLGIRIARHTRASTHGIIGQNVATAAAVYRAVVRGEALTHRIVTVTGPAVREAGNFEVALGTPFADLLDAAGGLSAPTERLLMGGPMMGVAIPDPRAPVIKASNCLLALPRSALAPAVLAPEAHDPCIRCGACAEACPVGLLPQQLYWHARAGQHEQAEALELMDCIDCGACAWVCPSKIPLVQYFRYAKGQVWEREAGRLAAEQAQNRHQFRTERLARDKAEREAELARRRDALMATQGQDAQALIAAAQAKAKAKAEAQVAPQNPEPSPARPPPGGDANGGPA